jgi:dihydropteroate synthase
VLNVTPDSFSDGGSYLAHDAAVAAGLAMVEAGAQVIDVGGESTRPAGKTYGEGARAVSLEEELGRVMPVVRALVGHGVCVSIDTTKAEVARAACAAGARFINDVSCGRTEALLAVAAEFCSRADPRASTASVELVLMHNRGRGERNAENVHYGDVVAEVLAELLEAVERAVRAGVARERVWIDPGIGFAKTARQSIALLARTDVLVATGQRVLVGPSRKSFIAEVAKDPRGESPPALARLGGTAATVATAVMLGAHAVRVHDVADMRQAALLGLALREARG